MSTENKGTDWSAADVQSLKNLVKKNTCTDCIAKKLGRTESAVRSKAQELGISLKPNDGKDCIKC